MYKLSNLVTTLSDLRHSIFQLRGYDNGFVYGTVDVSEERLYLKVDVTSGLIYKCDGADPHTTVKSDIHLGRVTSFHGFDSEMSEINARLIVTLLSNQVSDKQITQGLRAEDISCCSVIKSYLGGWKFKLSDGEFIPFHELFKWIESGVAFG